MATQRSRWPLLLIITLAILAGPVAGQTPVATPASPAGTTINIPDDALRVCTDGCAFASIDEAMASANAGDTIVVDGGVYDGPLVIDISVNLVGVNSPVIDGNNEGTVVRINAPGTILQGFTIRNSGSNFDKEDSAVYVEAENVQVLDNQLLNTLFGINAATSHNSVYARNYILGKAVEMGVRGDGIKVWYSHQTQILDNRVERSRDLLVWYSNDVLVAGNHVWDGRYGFHFMNSDNGIAERNRIENNSVAIYLMYGRNFIIRDNLLQGSRGPSGHGLGLKEIDGVLVEGNLIYDNRIGVFVDNSPLSPTTWNEFRNNVVAYNDQGFGILPSTRNNLFTQNSMIDNLEQVAILGGGAMGDNAWSENGVGNFWSDYAGYDADGDGIGDVPFRSEQLSEQLMDSWPILQLFRFSVAEAAVDFGSRAVPMFKQDPKLTDEHPLVSPVIPGNAPKPATGGSSELTTAGSLAMLALAAGAIWWGVRGSTYRAPTPNQESSITSARNAALPTVR